MDVDHISELMCTEVHFLRSESKAEYSRAKIKHN